MDADARNAAREAARAKAEQARIEREEAKEWKRRVRERQAAEAARRGSGAERPKPPLKLIVGGVAGVILAFAVLIGLGIVLTRERSKMPDLHPVTATVVKGGQPVSTVLVRLVNGDALVEQEFTVSGVSDAEGNVEFHTIEAKTGNKRTGVAVGSYSVKVQLPMDQNQGGGDRFELPSRYNVEAGENKPIRIDINRYLPASPNK